MMSSRCTFCLVDCSSIEYRLTVAFHSRKCNAWVGMSEKSLAYCFMCVLPLAVK